MPYYNVCPYCGDHLDPGERCDCLTRRPDDAEDNHIFTNETAENGFAFNFRVKVKRGPSGEGGYISGIQGGFQ